MMSGLIRNRSFWLFVALTLLGLAGVCASVGIIVWNRMSPPSRTSCGRSCAGTRASSWRSALSCSSA
jgi:hypothetical protein